MESSRRVFVPAEQNAPTEPRKAPRRVLPPTAILARPDARTHRAERSEQHSLVEQTRGDPGLCDEPATDANAANLLATVVEAGVEVAIEEDLWVDEHVAVPVNEGLCEFTILCADHRLVGVVHRSSAEGYGGGERDG